MLLQRESPCKVNLALIVLGKRLDGFHELETLMHPVPLFDTLHFEKIDGAGLNLTCTNARLSCGPDNLICRAAEKFFEALGRRVGLRIHVEKRIPLAAGLGGGSSNAAHTLLALNEMLDLPFTSEQINRMGAGLGSDVPFFLQSGPALGFGRGEEIEAVPSLRALGNTFIFLVHPGFGISTPWAYRKLAMFPEALHGRAGGARRLALGLSAGELRDCAVGFENSLEAPVLPKFPLLTVFKDFFRMNGAAVSLMSGSGSTTFALIEGVEDGERLREEFGRKFSPSYWTFFSKLQAVGA